MEGKGGGGRWRGKVEEEGGGGRWRGKVEGEGGGGRWMGVGGEGGMWERWRQGGEGMGMQIYNIKYITRAACKRQKWVEKLALSKIKCLV